jgi:hypothetical protein
MFVLVAVVAFGIWNDRDLGLRTYFTVRDHREVLDGCNDKDRCITVYVAPWCPVCKSSQSTMRLMHNYFETKRTDIGLNVVIGADKPENNAKERDLLSPLSAVTDDSGEIMRANAVSAFPTWIVRDRTGKEIFRKSSGLRIQTEDQVPILLGMLAVK